MSTNTIARLRADKGWSQRELARKTGLSSSTINEIEQGRSKGSIETAHKLAQVFDVHLALILNSLMFHYEQTQTQDKR